MCLMLYIGAAGQVPPRSSSALTIRSVDEARRDVAQWFSHPAVQFVGAHTGCSCGFPSVIAVPPIEYYEGMQLSSDDRAVDLRSVRALPELVRQIVAQSGPVELYPVADGDELQAPKGIIEWQLSSLDPERFFFTGRTMHVVRHRKRLELFEQPGRRIDLSAGCMK